MSFNCCTSVYASMQALCSNIIAFPDILFYYFKISSTFRHSVPFFMYEHTEKTQKFSTLSQRINVKSCILFHTHIFQKCIFKERNTKHIKHFIPFSNLITHFWFCILLCCVFFTELNVFHVFIFYCLHWYCTSNKRKNKKTEASIETDRQ